MAKKRIYEIAKELKMSNAEVLDKLSAAGIKVSGSLASVEEADVKKAFGGANKKSEAVPVKNQQAKPEDVTAAKKKPAAEAKPAAKTAPSVKEKPATKEKPTAKATPTVSEGKISATRPKATRPDSARSNATKSDTTKSNATRSDTGKSQPDTAATAKSRPSAAKDNKSQPQTKPRPQAATTAKKPDAGKSDSARPPQAANPPKTNRGPKPGPGAKSGPGPKPGPGARPGSGPKSGPGAKSAPAAPATPAPGSGAHGKRRRVIIDPSAAKRRSFVPAGRHQRPRHKGGRRDAVVVEEKPETAVKPSPDTPFKVNSGATVKDLAAAMGISTAEIIKRLMSYGEMATITQSLSDEAISTLADDMERQVEIVHVQEEEEVVEVDNPEDLKPRAPVVTIMGHVDHGKTSLLDAVREANVVAGEAGGITQHIGAYQVRHNDKKITFLDTPGHEAFTAMRARGAKVTDVSVLVVAADDGVMPQTIEAIDHSRAAGVPIIVAVNKIDKPEANPERVRQELSEHGLVPEDWGGENVFVDVSAKQHTNLENLLEMILLVAEVQELKANPDTFASGAVIESKLDPGRGAVATVLVARGTMRVGDAIVAGQSSGKVKAMYDFRGQPITEAGPSVPVEVIGFNSTPQAGEVCKVMEDEKKARLQATRLADRVKAELLARRRALTLDDVFKRIKEGEIKDLNLIIKADVAGSVEALEDALKQIKHAEVKINIIHTGVGGINESDVMLAAASRAIVIGFNVRPSAAAKTVADLEGVDVRTYSVIYKVTEDVQKALIGMLAPEYVEEEMGEAEVRQIFKASRVGNIAGCHMTRGRATRAAQVRLVRDGAVIYTGKLASLKRFKEDIREVEEGFECGILLEDFNDFKEGDVLEFFETKEIKQTTV